MIQKVLVFLFFIVSSISFSQTLYDFELKRDDSDQSIFHVYANPNLAAVDADMGEASFNIFLPTGIDLQNFISVTGNNWSTLQKFTGDQLSSAGFDDGSRDLLSVGNQSNDSFNFSHSTEEFLFCSFQVSSIPMNGVIEIVANDDPVVVSLSNAGIDIKNSYSINPKDGGVEQNRFNSLIGTTTYTINDPTLSNNSFSKAIFSVTPNPNTGNFVITTESALGAVDVAVYNITGKQVYTVEQNAFGKNALPVYLPQSLAAGAYFVNITANNASNMVKMIKN